MDESCEQKFYDMNNDLFTMEEVDLIKYHCIDSMC